MAILSYISATSTTPPIPQDQLPNPRPPTKILLPNKKPEKWSTGVAPGEYGGPPTTTKLRKYWGGEKEDPITSRDLIWNRDFMDQMKRLFDSPDDSSLDPSPSKVQSFSPNCSILVTILIQCESETKFMCFITGRVFWVSEL